MKNKKLQALYGVKWNPFNPDIPLDGLWISPALEAFLYRVESLVMDGGYALISGEPGLGKSKSLQLLANRLSGIEDVVVGVMQRPQSSLGDFYREMGDVFGVKLSPANRYGGFKALRERWREHIQTTLFRPVLLVDEAQEVASVCLNEIRLLGSAHFDSKCLLTTVLCGDTRLPERFRSSSLVSLGSRIRHRLMIQPYDKETLKSYLEEVLEKAGGSHLMTAGLINALITHCSGNLRLLNNLAGEVLAEAVKRDLPQLDEKLFLELYTRQLSPAPKGARRSP